MYGGDELCLTRSPFPEVVLIITQNLVTFQKFCEMTINYILRNWLVIGSLVLVTFLKQRCNEGFLGRGTQNSSSLDANNLDWTPIIPF